MKNFVLTVICLVVAMTFVVLGCRLKSTAPSDDPTVAKPVVSQSAPTSSADSETGAPVNVTQPVQSERRVIRLPAHDPNSNLDTAQRCVRDIINDNFVGDIEQRFPQLTRDQLAGLFLDTTEEASPEGNVIVISTGINYTQSFPQAREVADYCVTAVRRGLFSKFPGLATHSADPSKSNAN